MNLLKEARINIVPQPYGTTFIHSMSKNYPTVTLFPHDLKYLNYETKNVFEGLFNVGICHKDSESLKAFIEKIFIIILSGGSLQKLKMPNIYFAKYRVEYYQTEWYY